MSLIVSCRYLRAPTIKPRQKQNRKTYANIMHPSPRPCTYSSSRFLPVSSLSTVAIAEVDFRLSPIATLILCRNWPVFRLLAYLRKVLQFFTAGNVKPAYFCLLSRASSSSFSSTAGLLTLIV